MSLWLGSAYDLRLPGGRYRGRVLLINGSKRPVAELVAYVYGDTLEEMRQRKHAVLAALRAAEDRSERPRNMNEIKTVFPPNTVLAVELRDNDHRIYIEGRPGQSDLWWGILISDVVRTAATAVSRACGIPEQDVIALIRVALDRELDTPSNPRLKLEVFP